MSSYDLITSTGAIPAESASRAGLVVFSRRSGKSRRRLLGPLMGTTIGLGIAVSLVAAWRLPVDRFGLMFWILAIGSIGVGSRSASVKIPGFKTNLSISDIFIFSALLIFGGEAAILLGTAESFCSSYHITKKHVTRLFNAAVMAISTTATVLVLRVIFGPVPALLHTRHFSTLILASCVMGVVQYAGNSALVATAGALRANRPVWSTWKTHYTWISVGYVTAALAAAVVARIYTRASLYAIVAAVPILGIVYLTYMTYLRNRQASVAQAELAERHVAELKESEQRFRSAFDFAPIGMALVSTEGAWLRVNRSLSALVGYSEEELLSLRYQDITYKADLDGFNKLVQLALRRRIAGHQMEKRYVHKDGHLVWTLVSLSYIASSTNRDEHFIFQIQHIADRKRAEEQLLHDAFHDPLTGLSNRARFMEQLKMAIGQARAGAYPMFSVIFLDLDRFKVINDSIGHVYGDQLLVEVSHRLTKCLRPGDMVSRLGGDEFTILLTGLQNDRLPIRIAERIQKEISRPFKLGAYETSTSASIGIALCSSSYERAEDVLRDADTAMYHAKSHGKARYAVFDRVMHARAMSLMQLETDLRRALARGEFRLHYQPIVSLESGELTGFEALVRWQHPERGLISPAEFIPVAEETGCIVPLGAWVLSEACSQMREWEEQFSRRLGLFVSVNLSSKQLSHVGLLDQVVQTLNATGLDPRMLKLEITESVVMQNIETATPILEKLKGIGVQTSIDDFGTGYSSLSYLHRLPVDTLKIDRSFVGRAAENSENREIVRTIISLARNLGMGVVAEGVETRQQLDLLKDMSCDSAQGFYFSRPVDPAVAGQMIWDLLQIRAARASAPAAITPAEDDELCDVASTYQM